MTDGGFKDRNCAPVRRIVREGQQKKLSLASSSSERTAVATTNCRAPELISCTLDYDRIGYIITRGYIIPLPSPACFQF